MTRTLRVQPRYHRWFVEPGVEWLETNTHHATVDWDIPVDQCALVLVDVWQHHYLKDTEARSDRIMREKIVPLLEAARRDGVTVIHAPAPRLAKDHPNRFTFEGEKPPSPIDPEWPPQAFRAKRDDYAHYARPAEARQKERNHLSATNTIHTLAEPVPGEPLIADGEELHRYCKENGILFLFFLGFNTNACILMRDYGTLAMGQRGYEVILLRDCTTGMESASSAPELAQTQDAILMLEMFGKYSLTSDEFIAGLAGEPAQR